MHWRSPEDAMAIGAPWHLHFQGWSSMERTAMPRVFALGKEMAMTETDRRARNKGESADPNTKGNAPQHQGGDAARNAQEWGGGNKAGKGPILKTDKQNENSSAKS